MRLASVDHAISVCERYFEDSGSRNTEIETFLTQYLLIHICAAFEEKIDRLISSRAAASNDQAVAEFVHSVVGQVFRSIGTSEIGRLLRRFGATCKSEFRKEMDTQQRAETSYNSIVTNRHQVAHRGSSYSSLTFGDLVKYYDEGHVVLDAVGRVLKLV